MVSINLFLGYFILFYVWSYAAQAGFELLIYLPLFPKCFDYWQVPPSLVCDEQIQGFVHSI